MAANRQKRNSTLRASLARNTSWPTDHAHGAMRRRQNLSGDPLQNDLVNSCIALLPRKSGSAGADLKQRLWRLFGVGMERQRRSARHAFRRSAAHRPVRTAATRAVIGIPRAIQHDITAREGV